MIPGRPDLDDRYGRTRRPGQRRLALVAGAAAVVAVVAGLGWTGWRYANPPVSSRLLGWTVLDDGAVRVQAEVSIREGVAASCEVTALAGDGAVVGRLTVPVPAGPARQELLEPVVAVERTAVGGGLVGCTAPGAPRPR